eukprot:TRINITY_DN900_c0_g1_i2.p1 TRINITY_DN900_c0_g1~~TRINITY_DN900_c0_g1_i2.p1  ORF type:complete len:106 (+),score=1.72 TRINITY_DN900_c0_g1_i2:493-810(+)
MRVWHFFKLEQQLHVCGTMAATLCIGSIPSRLLFQFWTNVFLNTPLGETDRGMGAKPTCFIILADLNSTLKLKLIIHQLYRFLVKLLLQQMWAGLEGTPLSQAPF